MQRRRGHLGGRNDYKNGIDQTGLREYPGDNVHPAFDILAASSDGIYTD